MKSILKIVSSAIIVCLIPFSAIIGQGKKSEQKIKIVVADDSGTKVVIDTLIKDGIMNDSIRLKDGKMIFIGHAGDRTIYKTNGGSEHVFVTVSSDGKETGEKVIIIKDGKVLENEGDKTFEYRIKTDTKESDREKTKYTISKNGMVITIEGNDYEKVKELVKDIESRLDVKK